MLAQQGVWAPTPPHVPGVTEPARAGWLDATLTNPAEEASSGPNQPDT